MSTSLRLALLSLLLVAAAAVTACGDSRRSLPPSTDTGAADASGDSGNDAATDTGTGADTQPPDTGPADTGPPCSEDPCRLLSPQCGCPAGQSCQAEADTRSCRAVGPEAEGRGCTDVEQCQAELHCTPITESRTVGQCLRYCDDDTDCAGGGSRCILEASAFSLCTPDCDSVEQRGCPTGTGCYFGTASDGVRRYTFCAEPGAGALGSACVNNSDCRPGHNCLNERCYPDCKVASPACPSGTRCQSYGDPVVFDGVEFGYCAS